MLQSLQQSLQSIQQLALQSLQQSLQSLQHSNVSLIYHLYIKLLSMQIHIKYIQIEYIKIYKKRYMYVSLVN